jgi:hypothetical protein
MATVSSLPAVNMPKQQTPVARKDADGDNDGSKATPVTPTATAFVSKPTDTLGQHVNTHA